MKQHSERSTDWLTHGPLTALLLVASLSGCASMMRAAHTGDVEMVHALVAEGHDVNAVGDVGIDGRTVKLTPLQYAFYREEFGVAKALLEHGADPDQKCYPGTESLLMGAVRGSCRETDPPAPDIALIRLMLEKGANPNFRTPGALGNPKRTALLLAKSHEVVVLLVEAGADVNLVGSGGYAPLMVAAARGDLPSVDYLLKRGARADARKAALASTPWAVFDGQEAVTALHFALHPRERVDDPDRLEIVRLLISHGADAGYLVENFSVEEEAGKPVAFVYHGKKKNGAEREQMIRVLGNFVDGYRPPALEEADGSTEAGEDTVEAETPSDPASADTLPGEVSSGEDEEEDDIDATH